MENKPAELSKTEIENILREVISQCADSMGWANLADLGGKLRARGVRYKKLSLLMNEYKHMVETKIDRSLEPPVVYAKLK
ncbi:MAG: hypothetical protein NZ521_04545 [Flammeovirgaceae bacterium]|nr:hypothetical protein [Flammeovirgaceae bacterium]MDW8287911.1 hypothetical protein [Flammeovirgaceae bacterium]